MHFYVIRTGETHNRIVNLESVYVSTLIEKGQLQWKTIASYFALSNLGLRKPWVRCSSSLFLDSCVNRAAHGAATRPDKAARAALRGYYRRRFILKRNAAIVLGAAPRGYRFARGHLLSAGLFLSPRARQTGCCRLLYRMQAAMRSRCPCSSG